MDTAKVSYSERDGLATLALNMPEKLNSLSTSVFAELSRHIEHLEASTDSIGCVVLRGNGRSFSAGHDLGTLAAEQPAEPAFRAKVVERLANLPQPLVAAVHGHCYTGALELALAADIILAAENARFADTHAKWALTPVWGSPACSERPDSGPRLLGRPQWRPSECLSDCLSVPSLQLPWCSPKNSIESLRPLRDAAHDRSHA
jgi:enoyl-CoA hydratase/carnithine racemase